MYTLVAYACWFYKDITYCNDKNVSDIKKAIVTSPCMIRNEGRHLSTCIIKQWLFAPSVLSVFYFACRLSFRFIPSFIPNRHYMQNEYIKWHYMQNTLIDITWRMNTLKPNKWNIHQLISFLKPNTYQF